MATTTSTSALHCIVVTPEQTVLETDAEFVVLPLYDGEMGIARQHSPMIGRLGYGELRIRRGEETSNYYVDGGFVQVADDVVSVLTNRAISSDKVDGEAAKKQLSSALERRAAGEDQLAIRDRSIAQARAQLRIARRTK